MHPRPLSSVGHHPAVLSPERFRGGCAFGAGVFGRSLPQGAFMHARSRPPHGARNRRAKL